MSKKFSDHLIGLYEFYSGLCVANIKSHQQNLGTDLVSLSFQVKMSVFQM